MSPPLVSILLPARDAASTIDAAVQSMRRQTLEDFELLVIDDGSSDETPRRLAAQAAADSRLRVLRTPGIGIAAALEVGRAEARGKYLARMDADDVSEPARLALSVEALEAEPALAGVGTQVALFREDRPPSPNLELYARWLNSMTDADTLRRERFIESPLCHPSVTLRAAAVAEVGGWRSGDFPEDYALWLELLDAGHSLRAVPRVLHHWRDGEGRLTRTDPRYRPEAMTELKARHLARLEALRRDGATVWGAGNQGLRLARALRTLGCGVHALVDVSPRKVGQRIDGWPVLAPSALTQARRGHVIAAVGAKGAREEIRAFLEAAGLEEERDFTCAA